MVDCRSNVEAGRRKFAPIFHPTWCHPRDRGDRCLGLPEQTRGSRFRGNDTEFGEGTADRPAPARLPPP